MLNALRLLSIILPISIVVWTPKFRMASLASRSADPPSGRDGANPQEQSSHYERCRGSRKFAAAHEPSNAEQRGYIKHVDNSFSAIHVFIQPFLPLFVADVAHMFVGAFPVMKYWLG